MDGTRLATRSKEYPDSRHVDSLQVGAEFMDFVMMTLAQRGLYLQPFTSKKFQYQKGESYQGWEVKLDNGFTKYGHLSIEVAEKTRASNVVWVPSGIYRNDNTLVYIQGNYEYFYFFFRKHLVALHNAQINGRYRYERAESFGTVQKFYLPIEDADRWGLRVIPMGSMK